MTNHTPSDPQPTTTRHRRKGSTHDRNHQYDTAEQDADTGTGDGAPTSTGPNGSPDDDGTLSDTDQAEHDRQSATPARRRQRESYAQQQARLDAEAVDRWAAIVADWPPLSDEQIRALAVILNRIEARQRSGGNGNG